MEDDTLYGTEITEPGAFEGATLHTSVQVAVWAEIKDVVLVSVTVPEAPTAGVVAVQPAGGDRDTKVKPAGKVMVSLVPTALEGPRFSMTKV